MAKRRGVPAVHPDRKGFATGFSSAASAGYIIVLTNLSNTIGSLLGPVLLTALTPAFGGNTVYYIGIGIGGTLLATGCVLLIRTDMAREKARLEARAAC